MWVKNVSISQGREADTMPYLPKRKCSVMGCNQLTNGKYCDEHKKQQIQKSKERLKEYDKNRDKSFRVYDSNWQKFRLMYLRENPLCEMCGDKRTTATVIHHMQAIKNGGSQYDEDNLMALCRDCHEIIEGRKRKGNIDMSIPLRVQVILVAGSPLAGKTTYVKQNKGKNDLVYDYDAILAAMTGEELYHRPAWSIDLMLDIRETVMKYIEKTTLLSKAWIIATAPRIQQRQYFKERLNAKVIVVNPGKQTCLQRLQNNKRTSDYYEVITKWYNDYEYDEQDINI